MRRGRPCGRWPGGGRGAVAARRGGGGRVPDPARDAVSSTSPSPLGLLYGDVIDVGELVTELVLDALEAAAARPAELRALDRRREIDPAWFQRSRMIGYVCYADRFAGSLRGRGRAPRLPGRAGRHLPAPDAAAAAARAGENDGGYAVADYGEVDPGSARWTTCRRWPPTCTSAASRCASTWSLNHTAREHEWARKALAGEPAYRDDVPRLPGPDRTRRLRAHPARGLPRHRAGQLHRGTRTRLGVDDASTSSSGT